MRCRAAGVGLFAVGQCLVLFQVAGRAFPADRVLCVPAVKTGENRDAATGRTVAVRVFLIAVGLRPVAAAALAFMPQDVRQGPMRFSFCVSFFCGPVVCVRAAIERKCNKMKSKSQKTRRFAKKE